MFKQLLLLCLQLRKMPELILDWSVESLRRQCDLLSAVDHDFAAVRLLKLRIFSVSVACARAEVPLLWATLEASLALHDCLSRTLSAACLIAVHMMPVVEDRANHGRLEPLDRALPVD